MTVASSNEPRPPEHYQESTTHPGMAPKKVHRLLEGMV